MSQPIRIPYGWVPFVEPDGQVVYRPPNYGMAPSPGVYPVSPQVQQSHVSQPFMQNPALVNVRQASQHGNHNNLSIDERLKLIHSNLTARIAELEKRVDKLETDTFEPVENGEDVEPNKFVQNLWDEYAKDLIVDIRKTVDYTGRPKEEFTNDLDNILSYRWTGPQSKLRIHDDFAEYLLSRSAAYIHNNPGNMRTIVQLSKDYETGPDTNMLALLTVYNADDYTIYLKLALIKDDVSHCIVPVE